MKRKSQSQKKGKRVKKTLMTIAIALILVFFIGYGVNTFYEEPKWEDFCEERVGKDLYETQKSCEASGGKWTTYSERGEPMVEPVKLSTNQLICTEVSAKGDTIELNCIKKGQSEETMGWCNPNYKCEEDYKNAKDPHNRISFIILAIIGIIIVLISTVVLKENVVSYGALGGGILTILYGTIRFWGAIPDIWRFVILGVVLIVLIGIAWKKLK